MHSNLEDAMKLFPLLVQSHHYQIGLLSFLAGLFPLFSRRADVRDLPAHLLRDIGLSEHRSPDRDRLLR
jgi:hypothetical protein